MMRENVIGRQMNQLCTDSLRLYGKISCTDGINLICLIRLGFTRSNITKTNTVNQNIGTADTNIIAD